MRILFLSNLFPPHELGGYGQLCQEVADALSQRGHVVHVLTSNHRIPNFPISNETGREEKADSSTIGVTRTLHLQANIEHYQPLHFLRNFRSEEQHNLDALASLVQSWQPDLIFVWGMWNLTLQLPKLAETLLPGRVAYYICSYWPIDEDIHIDYWSQPTNKRSTAVLKKVIDLLVKYYFKHSHYPPNLAFRNAACVSQYVRNRLVDSGTLEGSAKVIYNGGDLTPFYRGISSETNHVPEQSGRDDLEPLRLLYFGRLIADKGVHTAFEALSHLRNDGYAERLRLTILGNGRDDYISELRRFAVEHDIAHLIHFHEGVSRDEVPKWLKEHNVFLFTSIWAEPLARSVMEAMMAGLLVIGSAVGGQTEMMVDGKNALTFHAGDSLSLANQIKKALEDKDARQMMARNGQEMVMTRFTQKRMVDEIEAWLESLMV